jgi:transposase
MARSKNGEAIGEGGCSPSAVRKLRRLIRVALKRNDLDVWRRGRAVLEYVEGRRVVEIAEGLQVTRGSVNRWLQWYEAMGVAGLLTATPPGPARKLSDGQRTELTMLIEEGPRVAGYSSGVWTGPMIGDVIAHRFGVRYHKHHVPRLLHELGFSVQRPRRRLARADAKAQATWLREKLPAIKKKLPHLAAS